MNTNLNQEVEDKEIAEILGISLERFNEIQINNSSSISLNTLLLDDSVELEDAIEDKNINIFEEVFQKLKKEEVLNILKKANLSDRELEIIYLHYGFYDKPKSLIEIAKIIGISRGRIAQIELNILKKLRQPEIAKLLACYLDNGDCYILKYEDVSSQEVISLQTVRNYFMKFSNREMEIILGELEQADLDFLSLIYSQKCNSIFPNKDIVSEFEFLVAKIENILNKYKRKI